VVPQPVALRCCYGSACRIEMCLTALRPPAAQLWRHLKAPRQWAIYSSLKNRAGRVGHAELRSMCLKMDAPEHSALLIKALDANANGQITFQNFCDHWEAVRMARISARLKHWYRCVGLGVAGNVAGHMEQAGEASPKSASGTPPPSTPAAIFAFYVPQADTLSEQILPETADGLAFYVPQWTRSASVEARQERLGPQDGWQFPVTNNVIDFPQWEGAKNVQVEPEIALFADIVYTKDGSSVERLVPRKVAAFNDCSIRQLDGSEKLSEKKNWGWGSKGISLQTFKINSFAKNSMVDHLVLVSYVKRDGQIHQYSLHAPARSYLMFHDALLDWIVDRMNTQQDSGKWENISSLLQASDHPTSVWIALGAGEYTAWGRENFLQPRDETLVIVYDEREFTGSPSQERIKALFLDQDPPRGIISLHQTFV